ncbi:MAG: hypothetical protein PHV34_22370 [Verrucomicrobiae bacterium]|nr:hypothetical protein [Verrucomicrobiae bacterium]
MISFPDILLLLLFVCFCGGGFTAFFKVDKFRRLFCERYPDVAAKELPGVFHGIVYPGGIIFLWRQRSMDFLLKNQDSQLLGLRSQIKFLVKCFFFCPLAIIVAMFFVIKFFLE